MHRKKLNFSQFSNSCLVGFPEVDGDKYILQVGQKKRKSEGIKGKNQNI